ncbi:MAG: hypothetical protein J6S82_05145 [Bacteroidales bacterium]|nr:hypothetical protein [Bacteroidales bacterium]
MKNSTSKTGRFFLLVAGLLVVMSACKKENAPSELRAVMNDYANSRQKAYIDPEQYSCFVVNEKIRANNNTGTIVALERNDRQCVIEDIPYATSYKAFYPYHLLADSANADLSGTLENKAVFFPQEQPCKRDADGNQVIANPMIAELEGFGSENNTLHFKNLCALLKVTVRTLDAFDAIHVTMSGQRLWGSGKISGSKVVMDGSSTTDRETVVLTLPAGHRGSPAGEAFYIMIPEVVLSGCTVTVSIKNGNNPPVKTFSRTGVSATLAYNCIHTLGNFTFNAPAFSVSDSKRVVFAPGNLQFQASGCVQENHLNGGNLVGGTWRFAEHQWDCIGDTPGNSIPGNNNANLAIRRTQSAWIDYFCWGTSGWNSGATLWTPFRTGKDGSNYYPGGSSSNDLTGLYDRADWGVFNKIYNPSTKVVDPAGTWYTPSKEDWVYILDTRTTPSGKRFAMAQVGGVNGMLIFPDNWDATWHQTSNDNNYTASYASNTMTVETFQQQLESKGVVFLPAAGNQAALHNESPISGIAEVGVSGSYWSSTHSSGKTAYGLYFTARGYGSVGPSCSHDRGHGRSVRLVRPVQ